MIFNIHLRRSFGFCTDASNICTLCYVVKSFEIWLKPLYMLRTKYKIWTKSDNFLLHTKIWGVYKKRKRSPWIYHRKYQCLTVNKVWVTHFIVKYDLVTQHVNFFWSKSGEEIALLLHGSHPTFSWTFSPIGSVWEKLWRFELSKPSWNSWQHFTFLLSWLF